MRRQLESSRSRRGAQAIRGLTYSGSRVESEPEKTMLATSDLVGRGGMCKLRAPAPKTTTNPPRASGTTFGCVAQGNGTWEKRPALSDHSRDAARQSKEARRQDETTSTELQPFFESPDELSRHFAATHLVLSWTRPKHGRLPMASFNLGDVQGRFPAQRCLTCPGKLDHHTSPPQAEHPRAQASPLWPGWHSWVP